MRTKKRLSTTFAGMLFIVLVSIVLGQIYPAESTLAARPAPTPRVERQTTSPAFISLYEVKDKLDLGVNIVLLDARPQGDYEAGHIKGAINLPYAQLEERFSAVRDRIPADAEIVTYCSGTGCELSTRLAEALIAKGFSRVKVFFGGWPDWVAAGFPVESGKSG